MKIKIRINELSSNFCFYGIGLTVLPGEKGRRVYSFAIIHPNVIDKTEKLNWVY